MKGLHILLEGLSYTGKTTQATRLVADLNSERVSATYNKSCPSQHKTMKFFLDIVGSLEPISPYLLEEVYAMDFLLDKKRINKRLGNGNIVVQDRGLASLLAFHQVYRSHIRKGPFQTRLHTTFNEKMPDLVVYLIATRGDRIKRMLERHQREINKYDTLELLHRKDLDLQREMEKLLIRYPHILVIDTSKLNIKETGDIIRAEVDKLV